MTALYLIDSDTGCVSMGPITHAGERFPGWFDSQIAAHQLDWPHRRFHIGPAPDPLPDVHAEWQWVKDLADRHSLPGTARWAQVTLRERPAAEVLRPLEDHCASALFCASTDLVLVTWRGRDDFVRGRGPRVWWRHAVCVAHLDEMLRRLLARETDRSPDAPRGIGVLIPVAAVVEAVSA